MPQFCLDLGSADVAAKYAEYDAFTRGYIEAMFFTECHADNPELDGATVAELAGKTWETIAADCAAFQAAHAGVLAAYYWEHEAEQAGRDFWYSRNGHGVGFFCRDASVDGVGCSQAVLDKLQAAAEAVSGQYLYRGDDGLLYVD